MKTLVLLALPLLASSISAGEFHYPPTRRVEATDTYFGRTYRDPYRWLESTKDKEVEAWFRAQADLTDSVLSRIPGRDKLADEWLALDKLRPASYARIHFENGRVFYKKTLGGQNVGKLHFREGWNGAETLLFDPETYKPGTQTVIQHLMPSWDGKHIVLGLTSGGAEYSELRVLDVDRKSLLPESIYPSWEPYSWTKDNRSFLYDAGRETDIRSMDIELNRRTRLHKLGTPVAEDADFFSADRYPALKIAPREWAAASIDESSPDYVIAQASTVQAEMRLFVAPASELNREKVNWQVLCKESDNIVRGITIHGDHVYAVTHTGAPKYKLVRTSIKNPDWAHAETVLPEAADSIQGIGRSRNYLFVAYSNGIVGHLVKYDLATGRNSDVDLPATGNVGISCPDPESDLCHVTITSWIMPPTRYDYDAGKETFTKSIFNHDVVYPGFADLVTKEVEVPGHDGSMVPLSIIHRKDMKLDGSNCCILEGYGAYGFSIHSSFNIQRSIATRGVVIAYAHPRGGGEKGEAWYKAGHKITKPNTWKDYIACAEHLVKQGYTSPAKLAGTGTSAGGILISRAITERPDLFRAAICNVGCANAMRLEFSPNGPVNIPEFGTVRDEAECRALFEMDGVQHVKEGVNYPAVLGVAGWNDPRVAAWQPGKLVATLQHAAPPGRPMLLKVNYDNGHFTEEKRVTFKNFAGQYAFLLWQTGHRDFQPAE